MSTFPGSENPYFSRVADVESDGFRELRLSINSHCGTHIDAPSHILANGRSISELPLSTFSGTGIIIDLLEIQSDTDLLSINLFSSKKKIDFVLFKTGWSRYWNTSLYFKEYPFPDNNIIKHVVSMGIKGVGIDTPSIDPIESHKLQNHYALLDNEIIVIENLTNLEYLKDTFFTFYCFPLNISNGDGSPVRAFAVL